jgi:hypothetical protein
MDLNTSSTLIMCVIVICVTVYHLFVDPRVAAMEECSRGISDSVKQVECAKAIFGEN